MKAAFEKIITWVLASSSDPAQASLTVKGALVGFAGFIPAVVLSHFNVDSSTVNSAIGIAASDVSAFLTFVGAIMTTYGAVRKVWLTIVSHPAPTVAK